MRPKTSSQSPQCFCRNRRMLGYQGLSSRFSIQRHSDGVNRTTQTGMPKAPAQWAAAVSTVITRSRFFMTAAVSKNVFNLLPRSTIGKRSATSDNCVAPGPVCRLNSWTPASFASSRKLSQRYRAKPVSSHFVFGLPGDTDLENRIGPCSQSKLWNNAAPVLHLCRINVQIGGSWDSGYLRSEQHGQAHHHDIEIESRQRGTVHCQSVDTTAWTMDSLAG